MAKKRGATKAGKNQRPKRLKLSAKTVLQRMQSLGKRREKSIADIREGQDGGVCP
jgi:hypothetical protein